MKMSDPKSFDNGEFQVIEPSDPEDPCSWYFGFGDEYSFRVEKLAEAVNYLLSRGVFNTFNGKVETNRLFRGY